jgi:hypothetical protein
VIRRRGAEVLRRHAFKVTLRVRAFVTASAVAALLGAAPGASAARVSADFFSPSGNIQCAMQRTVVICSTLKPFRRVDMNIHGSLHGCRVKIRCEGNLGEGAFELRYGHSVRVGRFKCTSRTTGVTCKVVKSGKGFRINRSGIKRVG